VTNEDNPTVTPYTLEMYAVSCVTEAVQSLSING